MNQNLFDFQAESLTDKRGPLAFRMRPTSLDEVVGQEHLLAPGRPLSALVEADSLSSILLWGPPGCGKTTIASLIAKHSRSAFERLSAVTSGVKDVRELAEAARRRLGENAMRTILFLDEIHRFNRTQQDALLPHVEEGLLTLVGATTENPYFAINGPLMSRMTVFKLVPVPKERVSEALALALVDPRGLASTGLKADEGVLEYIGLRSGGDLRAALGALEIASSLATQRKDHSISIGDAKDATELRVQVYGDDGHYDIASAFIKSIRGSDVDAGLYWLARMLNCGEDPRFIARRLVILASEDVGLADPHALVLADAVARAVEYVGLPETRINLAHGVAYLAKAPKSNTAYTALGAALADAEANPGQVPNHLADASYAGAATLGHGEGYKYPHDYPDALVDQQYRPNEVQGHIYYRPSGNGDDT